MRKTITLLACLILFVDTYALGATNFVPRLTLREEFTDNLDLTPDNLKSDWITSISPGANLEFRGRTSGLSFDYEPSVVMYSNYTENDTIRHRGIVDFWANLSRRTFFEIENTSMYTEEPISETDTTIRRGRNHYFLNATSTNLIYQFGPENIFDLGYRYEYIDNEDERVEDTQRHDPYVSLTYWPYPNEWGTETNIGYRKGLYYTSDDFDFYTAGFRLIRRFNQRIDGSLRYTYSMMEYDGSNEEGYQLHEVGPGLEYNISEDTRIYLELMYLYRDREFSEDQSNVLLFAEIFQRWLFNRNYIEVIASSGYRPDTFGAENNGFDIYADATARYTYSFSRQTYWDIFGSTRYDRYIDTDPEYIDNTFQAGTGLAHQFLSWATLRFDYTYRQVLSEIYEREYIENRAMLTLTLIPARGREAMNNSSRGRMTERNSPDESDQENTDRSPRRNQQPQ